MKFKLDAAGRKQQQAIRRVLSQGLPLAGLLALTPLDVSGNESIDPTNTPGKTPLQTERVAPAGDTGSTSGNESPNVIKAQVPIGTRSTVGIMPPPPPPPRQLPTETTVYVVKSGDVLCKIAKWYNTDTETLRELNHFDYESSNHLSIGQKIIVPVISSEKK